MMNTIFVETEIDATIANVWKYWCEPEHIINWSFASDEWESPVAENDLRKGGRFRTRMQAKDGSMGFDFSGAYTAVEEFKLIAYDLDDGRHVRVDFIETAEGVTITTNFDPENETPRELQRQGWQAILDNFRKYVKRMQSS